MVQVRQLSRWAIGGLVALALAGFLALMLGGDRLADWAVDLTPPGRDREIVAANEELKRALEASLPASHPLVQDVDSLGQQLVAAIPGGSAHTYRFHVIPSAAVNAFAFPGGDIFVNEALIRLAGNPQRLAAVLAHEIQHVEQRHGMRGVYRRLGRLAAFSMVLGIFGDDTAALVTHLSVLTHSRALETEADLRGLRLLQAAGLPRQAMVDMLNALAQVDGGVPAWLSSHPDSRARARVIAGAPPP